jgi:cell division protein FtsW
MVMSRADTSLLGRWWWSVDRWTLVAITTLIGFGYVMMLAASPAVAERIGETRDAFIFKQVGFLAVSGIEVVCVSMLSPRNVRRLALLGCIVALGLTAMTLVVGVEIKGARRWIALPGTLIACAVYVMILMLLKSQPDIGMLAVVTSVFFAQLFVGGLNLAMVGIALGGMASAAVGAFAFFPHVRSRVLRFLHPTADNSYQVDKSLEAFGNGGLLGRGPGEGHVKDVLPDAHADFVFAVAGEEFGFLVCLFLLSIFAFIVIRGLLKLLREHDMFIILAVSGLVTSFGLQAFVNMASSLHLIPTKGMTLPFVSYGGSSVLAIALGMGFLLALTRTRTHGDLA